MPFIIESMTDGVKCHPRVLCCLYELKNINKKERKSIYAVKDLKVVSCLVIKELRWYRVWSLRYANPCHSSAAFWGQFLCYYHYILYSHSILQSTLTDSTNSFLPLLDRNMIFILSARVLSKRHMEEFYRYYCLNWMCVSITNNFVGP